MVIVPAECEQLPIEPLQPAVRALPAEVPESDPSYLPRRTERAELSALNLAAQRNAEREARQANATVQGRCAIWATRLREDQEQ